MNEITEEKFKVILQQNDKKHQKNREIHNLLQMFHDSSTDILFRFRIEAEKRDYQFEMEVLDELIPLIEYVNECFVEISKTYNSVLLHIDNKLQINKYEKINEIL